MKKILRAVLFAVLLCCLASVAAAAKGLPFTDVKQKDWYYGSVSYVYENGMMSGTSATRFAPNESLTRAMFVTILGRLDGVKVNHKAATVFTDVKKGQYYTGYVKWGNDNGIVSGLTATTFGPDENITREQICALMIRYAKYKQIKLEQTISPITFKDASAISSYAKSAVKICQQAGLVSGEKVTGGYHFRPKGSATRGEAASIFTRFSKMVNRPVDCAHSLTTTVVDIDPTCGKDGRQHTECTTCGQILQENLPIPATGEHLAFTENTDIAPTDFVDGVKSFTCTNATCNYVYYEPILANGSLNNNDQEKFRMALMALEGSQFEGGELIKYLYYISFSLTPAVQEDPATVIDQLFVNPTGENSEKYARIIVPGCYGGKLADEQTVARLGKEKGSALQLSDMIVGDILCVMTDANDAATARFYTTNGTHLYDLTEKCTKLDHVNALDAIAENDYYALLRPSVKSSKYALRSLPLYEGKTDVEKAIISTAEAFLLRGDRAQYGDSRLTSSPIIYRWERGKSPEDYTSDETGYTNCTGFIHDIYLNALGYDYGSFNLVDAPAAMKAYTYNLTGAETDAQKREIEKEYRDALQVGDIVFYTYSGNTHAMLYVGNNNLMHATGNTYSNFKEMEEPTVRFETVNTLFNSISSRYIFQTEKPRTALYIIRPLNTWQGGTLPEDSQSRIAEMRGVFTEKTCSHTLGQTVNTGDTITYTFTLYNTTDTAKTILVTDTIPVGTTLLENNAPTAKKDLSTTVNLAAGERQSVSYTVKVNDNVTDGTALLCTENSMVGGIRTQCPAVYVGRTLTPTEQTTLKTIVNKKTGTTKAGVEMANEIYKELLGVNQILGADIDELKAGVFVTSGSGKTIPTTGKYAEMIAPSLYGGKAVLNSPRFGGERTRLPREHNLIVGDILYLQGSSTSSGLYIYMGDGVMLDLSKGLNERDLSDRLQNTIGWQHFAILRPSLTVND